MLGSMDNGSVKGMWDRKKKRIEAPALSHFPFSTWCPLTPKSLPLLMGSICQGKRCNYLKLFS